MVAPRVDTYRTCSTPNQNVSPSAWQAIAVSATFAITFCWRHTQNLPNSNHAR